MLAGVQADSMRVWKEIVGGGEGWLWVARRGVWEGLRANSVLGVMGLDDITIFGGKYNIYIRA